MSQLEQALARYAAALTAFKEPTLPPTLEQVLSLMLARDSVQAALNQNSSASKEALSQLVQLDSILADSAEAITETGLLARARQSLNPPPSSWWWFLEALPPKPKPQPRWAQYDWLWNLGTVACLVMSTSFLMQSARAFSAAQGFDFWGTLSTISQGAGVVLVAGGALTDKGQKVVERALTSLKIPPYLHAEATFSGAVATLGFSYLIYSNLPLVGRLYYQQGQRQQLENRWSEAQESYRRAIEFIPNDLRISLASGSIYETLGNFSRAIAEYEKGALVGDPAAMNALARAQVWQAWEQTQWRSNIDPETARTAALLYERAITFADQQPNKTNAHLLQAEIRTNQAILHWATVGWDSGQEALLRQIWLFDNAVLLEQEAFTSQTASAVASRTRCYNSLGPILHFAFEQVPSGVDPRVAYRDFEFSCFDILRVAQPEHLHDSKVVGAALSLEPVEQWLRTLAATPIEPVPMENPNLANQLQLAVRTQIQQNLDPKSLPSEKISLRVFVNPSGQIVRYYAYDQMSQDYAYTTPVELLWQDRRPTPPTSREPLVEFKVTFQPSGEFEIVPWSAKLKTMAEPMAEPADIGVLQHCLFAKIDRILSGSLNEVSVSRADGVFYPSLVYRVSLTPDGKIADYEPLDKTAAARFSDTPLAQLPKSNSTEGPFVEFEVEFKAADVFKITPQTVNSN
jgi:tetratricopeptide (TPR) repeat protein